MPDTLHLPRTLIPALMMLAAEAVPAAAISHDAIHQLERLELACDGRATPLGRRLVDDMTEAELVISIECETADLPYRSTIWARSSGAIWGRPVDSDVFELRRIDPIQLPLLLAQVTDVGRRPRPPFSGTVAIPTGPLDAVRSGHHDHETAFGILVAAGVEPAWADRLLIAWDHRRIEWTVASVWTDPDGDHGSAEVRVLDAGPAGYWHVHANEDGTTSFTVGSLESVMRWLRRTVPGWCGRELPDQTSAASNAPTRPAKPGSSSGR